MKSFYKTGHRGCRGLMPENTIISFVEAVKLGCNAIELDVVVSGDRNIVVSHDPYMNPLITLTPDGKEFDDDKRYNLYKMSYDEIKKFDVGNKKNNEFDIQTKFICHKPLLHDAIEEVERYVNKYKKEPIVYDIEIKSSKEEYDISQPSPEEIVDLLIPILYLFNIVDRVILRSFDVNVLRYLNNKYPFIKTALIIEDSLDLEYSLSILGFTPTIYSPKYDLVTKELVETCHKNNMLIIPWTVNDLQQMINLSNINVDGIISDYPNLFQFL